MRQWWQGGNKNKGREETGAGNVLEEEEERGIEGIKKGKGCCTTKSEVYFVKIKRNQLRSWPTLRFDASKWAPRFCLFSFWFPCCFHLLTKLTPIFKQKETDNNKKLFPCLRNEMSETRGNRRGPKRFPSSLLPFISPPLWASSSSGAVSSRWDLRSSHWASLQVSPGRAAIPAVRQGCAGAGPCPSAYAQVTESVKWQR